MAITIREYLGDEKIAQLESMGFLPSLITDMAKRQYAADKQAKRNELSDAGLDGKLVQGIMRGDINEEEAKNAQKFEDFGSKKHGWGLGAAKTLTGIANTAERVSDFINPFYEGKYDENGNYIYQNGIEKSLRPRIKNVEKMRDDYEKATGETSWGSRLAEIGTEMVGDPINFIGGAGLLSKGSKLAQFGKKTLFFAGTGAASGGVMALGEGKNDEETLKNIGYGAAGGFVLGHAIDQGIQGISKLIAKRQASRVANEADAIDNAQNSEFLDGGNSASGDGVGAELKEAQTMTAMEFATKEAGLDEDTATNVLKEAMQGKEKSDWTDADTYADIVKFKNFEIQREYTKAYGEKIQATQASINNAREQSAIRYADTQKAISEYQKQGMSPSAARELINAKFKPSADEINYTRAYNDGADVDARLAGQGIFYALEKDIATQAYTPEIYATRLKQRGFSDESVQAFTQAYIKKDINIAKDYANSKVAQVYENKIQAEVANEIRDRDEVEGGFVNEEAKNNGLSDSVSDIGDNASRTGERQGDDEEILRKGGRNTSSTSQTKRTAQSNEQMEQQPAFKTDGDTDATAASKQMVEEQGSGDNEIRGHVGQTQEEYKKLANEYDVDKFLSDRENVLSKDARHGKNRITDRTIESNDGVGGWEYKLTPAGYEKNYKADFLTTKADVAKIRAGKMDEAIFNKLKSDLESSDALGYEYKKGSEYADMEDFEREFGSLYNPKGGRNINANSHIASGLVGGTLNSIDEDGSFNPEKFAAGFIAGLAGSKAVAIAARKMTPQFYNKILGAAKKMPQMAKDNPKLLGKLYANGKDISINSFAGEKAITANVGKLDQAKAMLEKGADEVEIWQKTGWFKDKDGAWKFEIGDSKARLNPNFKSGGKLGELLEHEELFKAYPELEDISIKKISNDIPKEASLSTKDVAQREKRGIYNVTYNDKSATLVRRDLEKIDDALMFEKGSNKKGGAIHIKKHLEPEAQGAITQSELLNIGKNIREYLQKFKEPFIDEHGGRIYEWGNKEGVKFRVVVYEKTDGISASHPETIISFYSNRNLKKPMEFRNPEVKYDVNLRQWHKDSAPITKNADGSPKTFYHGSKAKDITEFKDEFDKSGYGFWFNQSKSAAVEFKQDGKIYQVYLNVKNPIDLSFPYSRKAKNLLDEAEKLGIDTELYPESQSGAFKKFLEQKGYDGIVMDDLDGAAKYPHVIVFHSNQIKHVKNDGSFSDSPNIYKSGKEGYYSPAKNEIGLRDLNDKSTLMHEVQHAIQEIEDFARGGNMVEARSYLLGEEGQKYEQELKGIDKTLSNLSLEAQHMRMRYSEIPQDVREYEDAKELFRAIENREKAYAELSVLRDDLYKKLFEIDKKIRLQDIRETYRKIHGEAEARNVESRLNLDGKAHPHETFDVNPNETIVSKEDGISYNRKIEEIKREHPSIEKELDESIATMNKESFNDSNFKDGLIGKFDTKEITTQELGKSVNLSDKQLAVLKNDMKNADFKVISDSKIYFDKVGKDGDKKRFFIDIAEDGNIRVDAYAKSQIDNMPIKENALQELAGVGDRARLKNMSFEVKAAYHNELDPIKKEAILKTAELNKLKKAAQSGDKMAMAKFEEFKAKNLDKDGNIKDGLRLC
ncbi:ADP-ribosyltransferase-containing protein [Campylobacter concisus]|uniref:ADP-ribosyltransferase-containing protein n=1 Tax=Campylobacter concisus TaxID=199 RepID=UPI0015D8CC0B|nr:LPD23 domain-containing protein [Campylobacter concisus]